MHYKSILKRGMVAALTASMLITNNIADVGQSVCLAKEQEKQQKEADEETLKEMIRESDEKVAAYPKGEFNFLATQYNVGEGDKCIQIGIMRQGGTEGEASVRFKAIDITSEYGKDYKIYESKEKNNPISKGENAFPIIQTAYTDSTDLSEMSAEEIVANASKKVVEQNNKKSAETKNPLDSYKDAKTATTVKADTTTENTSENAGLQAAVEQTTGNSSDRKDWKVVADGSGEETAVRDNFNLFLDTVDGSEATLTFEDGEYIKYLYLFPEDDKESEADEQALLALLQNDEEAPVGDSYNAYVNIKDNDKKEEAQYRFTDTEISTDGDKATVTVERTAGTGYYTSLYIGTEEGSANPGADYTAGLQKVTFYAGQTKQKVSVKILDNEYRDKDRDFYIRMSKDGATYLKSSCHVNIIGNGVGAAKAMANTEGVSAGKITRYGNSTAKGSWTVSAKDFNYSGGATNNGNIRASFSGVRNGVSATLQQTQLYGVESVSAQISNNGYGRDYQVRESYYKNGWNKFWDIKSYRMVNRHENAYNTTMNFGSWMKQRVDGRQTKSVTSAVSVGDYSKYLNFGFYANQSNQTDTTVSNVVLKLKAYGYACEASEKKFSSSTYKMTDDKLEEQSKTDITPVLSLKSVSSNVKNEVPNADANTKIYCSDTMVFQLAKYDTTKLEFVRLQAKMKNSGWINLANKSLSVCINADFLKQFGNNVDSDKIEFRPVFKQKDATVKFELENETKGTYSNITKDKKFNVHIGDTITNIQGKSGAVAAYQPTFSCRISPRDAFVSAANNRYGLYLDKKNSEGAVACITVNNANTEVRLAYSEPSVTVMANPNIYRNSIQNTKITVDGIEYDCNKQEDIEKMQAVMSEKYKNDTDAQVSISFEYYFNPEYMNGKGNQEDEFGTPKYAMLYVYDDEVLPKYTYKLEPIVTQKDGKNVYTFTKSGNWKELGWKNGTAASALVYGTEDITTREINLDFLSTNADYVMVNGSDSTPIKDKDNNITGSLTKKLIFNVLSALESYKFIAITSDRYTAKWGDFSMDSNQDGSITNSKEDGDEIAAAEKRLEELGKDKNLAQNKSSQIYFGNVLQFSPDTFAKTKLYYSFEKKDTTNSDVKLGLQLTEVYSTVINPNNLIKRPLSGADVTLAGDTKATEETSNSANKYTNYSARGNFVTGANYQADVLYQGYHFQGNVIGAGTKKQEVNTSEIMFPVDFSVTQEGKDTGVKTGGEQFLPVENKSQVVSFNFKSSIGVIPNKAVITIYTIDNKKFNTYTVTRTKESDNFEWTINPAKEGIKPGSTMTIQGIYERTEEQTKADGTVEQVSVESKYPEVPVGLVYQSKLTALTVAASFQTAFAKPLKMFGKLCTKFDLALDYDLEKMAQKTSYTDQQTGADVQTLQIAFGYNNDVMKKLKELQTEHKADNKGEAMSGRGAVNAYIESLMEDDDEDEKKDDDKKDDDKKDDDKKDDDKKVSDKDITKDNVAKKKENAEKAQQDAHKNKDTESSFDFDFSVAVVLTVESGITKNESGEYKADGQNYFNSLALIASADAQASTKTIYTTPIGVDLMISLSAEGKAVVAFGVESANSNPYADVFNLSKNGADKDYKFNKNDFSIYTKFLLAPSITVGAGVGIGGGKIASAEVSGTADFNFGFDVPILGDNTTSSGNGTLELSAQLKIKVLFIKKKWTLYKSNTISLFDYGTASVADMMNDFEDNYLYEDVNKDVEVMKREYLDNRSEWQPYDASAMKVEAGKEVILEEGAYPNPSTKVVDLGNDKLLMVYVDDVVDENGKAVRDEYNRSQIVYTVSSDNGVTWSEPATIDADGTWDEAPNAFVVEDGKVLVTWSDASRVYTAEDKVEDTLSLLDISGAWFDTETMSMGSEFAITTTNATENPDDPDYDLYQDAAPMVAYDATTKRLMVYYTKTDYSEKAYAHSNNEAGDIEDEASKAEVTTYGDLVNGYSVIAYRYADYKDGAFVWNTEGAINKQNVLDLAVPGQIVEKETATEEDPTQTKITRDIDVSKAVADPRVIDSDVISYNGLALYAYTMDCDQKLDTTDDQQLYMQIYNFNTNEFHHPIQITSDASGNTNPKFVRCKNMTYLYWLSGGDVKYINITDVVRSMSTDDGYLKLKTVEYTDAQGTSQKTNLYILDRYDQDPIETAIVHEKEVDEEGNVTEDPITSFDIKSNGNSMYLLWTAMTTSVKDQNATGADNVVRETQVFGAYCEPQIELKETEKEVTFDNTDEYEYTFAEGKENNTYPVSAKILKAIDDGAGKAIEAGTEYTFDYSKDTDVNGEVGKVKAGDKALEKIASIEHCKGSNWSTPIQITRDQGANYTDLSFRITQDDTIQATFARGAQSVNPETGCFEEEEGKKVLAVQNFVVTSTLETSDIICKVFSDPEEDAVASEDTSKENAVLYQPGDTVIYELDVTNDGLKPLDDVTYRTYVTKNGQIMEDNQTDWAPIAEKTQYTGSLALDTTSEETAESQTDADQEVNLETTDINQFIGGNTIAIEGTAELGDDITGLEIVVELKDSQGNVTTVSKPIETKKQVDVTVDHTELLDEKTAEITAIVSNTGNLDFAGPVEVVYGDKVIATVDNVTLAAGERKTVTVETDISNCEYGKLETLQDGSKQDSISLVVSCGGIATDTKVSRMTSPEGGKAVDAITGFEIGASDATSETAKAEAVNEKLTISPEQVTSLESMFKVDENSAKVLSDEGYDVSALMTTEWKSSDASVAYVSDKGLLVPMKEGDVEITAITYPESNLLIGVGSADEVTRSTEDEEDFGTVTEQAGTGSYVQKKALFKIPASLIQKKTILVHITADPNATKVPEVTATAAPTVAATTAPEVTATTAPTVASDSAIEAPQPDTTDSTVAKKKKISKLTVKVDKTKKKVTIKTIKGAKVQVKVYKTKAFAKKNKKKGLVKTYTIASAKNKKGTVVLKLKKKLKGKQVLRVTVSKKGYTSKTKIK